MFPAARKGDPITHDLLVPSGVIGPPLTGPCPKGPVLIEGMPAAHASCTAICSGAVTGGIVHPPVPPPVPPPPIVSGSGTVLIHNMPAARWAPSGDSTACGSFLGDPKLAPTRKVLIGGPTVISMLALTRTLIRLEGTADAADGELVAQELAKLPPHAIQILRSNQVKVVVCRGSVTEYRTDLRGVQPRGWKKGSTWDSVPGAYTSDRNEVVISTVGHGTPGGAHVPATGEGHGSSNLAIHESMHAVDHNAPASTNSSSIGFNNARNIDLGTLSGYELQAGPAGQEETYAESAARYYGGDPDDAAHHPNLHNYWAGDPLKPSP